MSESTEDRRKRLKLMREKAGKGATKEKTPEEGETSTETIKFRNYNPVDESLKDQRVMKSTVIPDASAELKEQVQKEIGDESLLNIAPKKPNWDLKRDVEKKLEKLNKRTQRAIVEIIRERLEAERAEEGEESSGEEESEEESDDDEEED